MSRRSVPKLVPFFTLLILTTGCGTVASYTARSLNAVGGTGTDNRHAASMVTRQTAGQWISPVSRTVKVSAAQQTVHIDLRATLHLPATTRAADDALVTVPRGWMVDVTLQNAYGSHHQALILPYDPYGAKLGAGTLPPFAVDRGAHSTTQDFMFKGRTPGDYAIVCTTPGHRNEMFGVFRISETVTKPSLGAQ